MRGIGMEADSQDIFPLMGKVQPRGNKLIHNLWFLATHGEMQLTVVNIHSDGHVALSYIHVHQRCQQIICIVKTKT